MPRPSKVGKIRMSLELSSDTDALLKRLLQRSDAETRTEVIRRALRVYDTLLEVEEQGGQILIRNTDGERMLLKVV